MGGIRPVAAILLGLVAATIAWFGWGILGHLYTDHVQVDLWRAAAIQQQLQAQQPQPPR